MTRVLAVEVVNNVDKKIYIEGWLHKKRLLGGLTFINVRDRSGLVQVLISDKKEVEKLRGLQIGTVVRIDGEVKKEPRAPGGAELHNPKIEVLVPVEEPPAIEIDKPIDHKPDNLDTLFENRVVGLRNLQETSIFKVQATICRSLEEYFAQNDFTQVHTPKLLAQATEGGAEVFKLDYFGKEATLAQSPQFYKQMLVGVFERVYEIAPVYRAELSATTRHMSEYISIDAEMGFITLDDLLKTLNEIVLKVVEDVWKQHQTDLDKFNSQKPLIPYEIPRMTMAEIHEKYSKATGENTVGEKDLRPDEERWICEYAKKNLSSDAVFVTEWPASEMKFYHKKNEKDSTLADRADLLFRGVEIVTASMRENEYPVLLTQLKEIAKGSENDPGFKYYLEAFKFGLPVHGGFGMGLERLTQKIVGLNNVKEATLFPRDINRLTP